jgi:hypothetical protein
MRLAPLPSTRRTYWHDSRAPRYSLTFALPLLVLYELMAASLEGVTGGVRNGADVMIKMLFVTAFGGRGPLIFGALLIGLVAWLVVRDARGRRIEPATFVLMFAESVALALVFGVVVGIISAQLLSPFQTAMLPAAQAGPASMDLPTRIMVSLGAGLYEELLFRVVLVGALLWGSRKLLGWGPVASGTFATLAGALIFSAFHYIGPFGDPFDAGSFTFRAVAGVAFSALYIVRGFGITAWTHALYDLMLLAVRG